MLTKKSSILLKVILKNLTQKKKLNMNPQVGQFLQNDHLTRQKMTVIIIEE